MTHSMTIETRGRIKLPSRSGNSREESGEVMVHRASLHHRPLLMPTPAHCAPVPKTFVLITQIRRRSLLQSLLHHGQQDELTQYPLLEREQQLITQLRKTHTRRMSQRVAEIPEGMVEVVFAPEIVDVVLGSEAVDEDGLWRDEN